MMRTPLCLLLLISCSHDWDKLDPRLEGGAPAGGSGTGATSNAGGQPSGGGGASGGAETSGGAGASGGAGGAGASGGTGAGEVVGGGGFGPCTLPGDPCVIDDDCCQGITCQPSGFCGVMPTCKGNGQGCTEDEDCCSLDCSGGSKMCEGFND